MEITKYKKQEILFHIRHNIRELPDGKNASNKSIIPELSKENYHIICRGNTAAEINNYRKKIAEKCFQYSRSNLIHALEFVIQSPSDLDLEKEKEFFQTAHEFICSTLPMGEEAVFLSIVHRDEKCIVNEKNISKNHLHIMAIPAVQDHKHTDYNFKLCANDLTRKPILKTMHSKFQEFIDEKGIPCTVYNGKNDGKRIGLSVQQLKILSQNGIVLEKSLTVEELAKTLKENINLKTEIQRVNAELESKNSIIKSLSIEEKERSWGNSSWKTEYDIDMDREVDPW